MSQLDWWIPVVSTVIVLTIIGILYHRLSLSIIVVDQDISNSSVTLPKTKWYYHIGWFVVMAVIGLAVPPQYAQYIFSNLLVTCVATVFPIYESIRAVCTPEEHDDKSWLQYWMVGGILFIGTGWVDDVMMMKTSGYNDSSYGGDDDASYGSSNSNVVETTNLNVVYWYEAMFAVYLWLYFPITNGAALIYHYVTKPYLTPIATKAESKMNSWIVMVYNTMINTIHLWIVWMIFMFLPAGLKRIVTIGVGTIYPFTASVAAAATEQVEDDTYWLTYWSCYGCLFLIMDVLEIWMGWIPGFYTLVIFATVYLMLPMFQGADKIFRNILVPIAGLKELLLLRDAIQVKKTMLKDLDPERARVVRKAIARFFDQDDDDQSGSGADQMQLKRELMTGWNTISFRRFASRSGSGTTTKSQNNSASMEMNNLSTPIV